MTPTTLNLDCLPREILRQIVALGSCQTVITLTKVNKRLQRFCDDPGLFKSILENHRGHEVATWYSTVLSMESPISSWACYALSDAKAAQWSLIHPFIPTFNHYSKPRLSSDTIARFRDLGSWGPQLMVSYHPFPDTINTTTLFRFLAYNWPASNKEHDARYGLVFCFVMKIFNETPTLFDWWRYRADEWLRPDVDNWDKYFYKMRSELRHPKQACSTRISLSDGQNNNEVTTETRHRLLVVLGLLFQAYHGRYKNSFNVKLFPLPSPRNIPFISMMNLPPPLSLNAADGFATCHLSKMTSKEFFDDGPWSICRSTTRGHKTSLHVPERIKFFATKTEAHSSKMSLRGSGFDWRGDYSLEGSIGQETGRVHLLKWYNRSRPDMYLSGLMTPFGIVGVYSDDNPFTGGWFWLWKDAWTQERESLPHA